MNQPRTPRARHTRYDGDEYSNASGKQARRDKKAARKVAKSKLKGEKERAALGLDEVITIGQKPAGKNNAIIYIIAGAVLLAVVIFFIIKKRK